MKRILIDATGSSGWIGGVYHKKNILFSLLLNDWIRQNAEIVVVTNHEYRSLFEEFSDRIRLCTISCKGLRDRKIKIAAIALRYKCSYIFPHLDYRINRLVHAKSINWIPDYQHYHYPGFFTESDLHDRKAADIDSVDSGYPLVLSSNSCLNDFREYVSKTKENVYVVPFVSYIEKEASGLTQEYISGVCAKYNVTPGGYVMTANQFWQHKNHVIIFEALRKMTRCDKPDTAASDVHGTDRIRFLFTGEVADYRSDEYSVRMREYLADPDIAEYCVCTGFIDRREQLALMKGARFLVQPSLFEGWGTVLEDAKVLDKRVLLSDIPVHREQMNGRCTLFDPHDADELAELLVYNWNQDSGPDDVSGGIETMYRNALKYSEGFERLFKEA